MRRPWVNMSNKGEIKSSDTLVATESELQRPNSTMLGTTGATLQHSSEDKPGPTRVELPEAELPKTEAADLNLSAAGELVPEPDKKPPSELRVNGENETGSSDKPQNNKDNEVEETPVVSMCNAFSDKPTILIINNRIKLGDNSISGEGMSENNMPFSETSAYCKSNALVWFANRLECNEDNLQRIGDDLQVVNVISVNDATRTARASRQTDNWDFWCRANDILYRQAYTPAVDMKQFELNWAEHYLADGTNFSSKNVQSAMTGALNIPFGVAREMGGLMGLSTTEASTMAFYAKGWCLAFQLAIVENFNNIEYVGEPSAVDGLNFFLRSFTSDTAVRDLQEDIENQRLSLLFTNLTLRQLVVLRTIAKEGMLYVDHVGMCPVLSRTYWQPIPISVWFLGAVPQLPENQNITAEEVRSALIQVCIARGEYVDFMRGFYKSIPIVCQKFVESRVGQPPHDNEPEGDEYLDDIAEEIDDGEVVPPTTVSDLLQNLASLAASPMDGNSEVRQEEQMAGPSGLQNNQEEDELTIQEAVMRVANDPVYFDAIVRDESFMVVFCDQIVRGLPPAELQKSRSDESYLDSMVSTAVKFYYELGHREDEIGTFGRVLKATIIKQGATTDDNKLQASGMEQNNTSRVGPEFPVKLGLRGGSANGGSIPRNLSGKTNKNNRASNPVRQTVVNGRLVNVAAKVDTGVRTVTPSRGLNRPSNAARRAGTAARTAVNASADPQPKFMLTRDQYDDLISGMSKLQQELNAQRRRHDINESNRSRASLEQLSEPGIGGGLNPTATPARLARGEEEARRFRINCLAEPALIFRWPKPAYGNPLWYWLHLHPTQSVGTTDEEYRVACNTPVVQLLRCVVMMGGLISVGIGLSFNRLNVNGYLLNDVASGNNYTQTLNVQAIFNKIIVAEPGKPVPLLFKMMAAEIAHVSEIMFPADVYAQPSWCNSWWRINHINDDTWWAGVFKFRVPYVFNPLALAFALKVWPSCWGYFNRNVDVDLIRDFIVTGPRAGWYAWRGSAEYSEMANRTAPPMKYINYAAAVINAWHQHYRLYHPTELGVQQFPNSRSAHMPDPEIEEYDALDPGDYVHDLYVYRPGVLRTFDWRNDTVLSIAVPRLAMARFWNDITSLSHKNWDGVGLLPERISGMVNGVAGSFDLLQVYGGKSSQKSAEPANKEEDDKTTNSAAPHKPLEN